MAKVEVGADVQGLCNKCGVVAHVIVAVIEGAIHQVECKECNARHKHRKGPVKKKTTRKTTAKAKLNEPAVEPDLTRPVRSYSVSETYTVGDRIEHGSFGAGVVERVAGPKKVQVWFAEGTKTLLQGRPAS